MYSIAPSYRILIVVFLSFIVGSGFLRAGIAETRGAESITEGLHYVVAFPQVWAAPTEKPLPVPMTLLISSKSGARVRIRTLKSSSNDNAVIDQEFLLEPNVVRKVPVSMGYMHDESEVRKAHGIMIDADHPISVATYQAWNGNGEIARHLPVEGWGTEYYSMNFYQDRYGTSSAGYKYRPGQILIIAAMDNTLVSYTPTVTTEGGKDAESVPKGLTRMVKLDRGETFLIRSKIDPQTNKEWSSDLTGTLIHSNYPIGVVSGHTKVAIMRYPDVLPPTGAFAVDAHFVRNNVHDAMFPNTMAGTEFVTLPCTYTTARVTGMSGVEYGIDDDRGDAVRVIALHDNTLLQSLAVNGSSYLNRKNLRRGESYVETSLDRATVWKASKPVLMVQYGKSYARIMPPLVGRSSDGKDDKAQGYPAVEAGQPMMQGIPSVDRWVSYGVFSAPEGVDNFLNIVFRVEDAARIRIDGRTLTVAYPAISSIAGSPYAFIRVMTSPGDHIIESTSPSVRWMAWTYGSADGLQQGRAYGTPVSVDISIACDDSLAVVEEEAVCGDVDAWSTIVPSGSTRCGSIVNVEAIMLTNYEFIIEGGFNVGDTSIHYRVRVIDRTQDATARVRMRTRSGKYVEKTYTYEAVRADVDPTTIDFGMLEGDTPSCRMIRFSNPGLMAVDVKEVKVWRHPEVFTFDPATFTLPPGTTREIMMCATIPSSDVRIDDIIVRFDCHEAKVAAVRVRGDGDTTVSVDDDHMRFVVGTPSPMPASVYGTISIPIDASVRGEVMLALHDAVGRIVGTAESMHIDAGSRSLRLDLPVLNPSPGLHILRIQMPSGAVRTLPLMLTN